MEQLIYWLDKDPSRALMQVISALQRDKEQYFIALKRYPITDEDNPRDTFKKKKGKTKHGKFKLKIKYHKEPVYLLYSKADKNRKNHPPIPKEVYDFLKEFLEEVPHHEKMTRLFRLKVRGLALIQAIRKKSKDENYQGLYIIPTFPSIDKTVNDLHKKDNEGK